MNMKVFLGAMGIASIAVLWAISVWAFLLVFALLLFGGVVYGCVVLFYRGYQTHLDVEFRHASLKFEHAKHQALITGTRDGSNVKVTPDGSLELVRFLGSGHVTINEAPPLELPEPNRVGESALVPTFAELLSTHQIIPNELESILGYTDGEPRKGQWAMLHSFMALGLSGSGKSSTVAYYTGLAVLHGARLLIIDPDAEEEDSLTRRLEPLSFAFLCKPGTDPDTASTVLEVAEQELLSPGAYPVVWCVDEFSTIMRYGQKGMPGWGELADRLAVTVEDWAQRGRKRKRTVIAIGQVAKASRTGGTELRASMTATFVHRLPAQQARLVIDTNDANQAPRLDKGEVIVLLANSEETYRMHIPYTTPEDMHAVARLMQGSYSGQVAEPETPPALHIVKPSRNDLETELETASQAMIDQRASWQAKVSLVRDLWNAGRTQKQIIQQVWGMLPGASREYATARDEYNTILDVLRQERSQGMEV
jgi:hypothetical protein